jgi:hypothetical protein
MAFTIRQARVSCSTGSSQARTSFFSVRVSRQRRARLAVEPMCFSTRPNIIRARSHRQGMDGNRAPLQGGSGGS